MASSETSTDLSEEEDSRGVHTGKPPGAKDTGSAWDLPEIKQVIEETKSSTVEFNTCAYQSKLRKRWYKRGEQVSWTTWEDWQRCASAPHG